MTFGADSDLRILTAIKMNTSGLVTVGTNQSHGSDRKRAREGGDGTGLLTLLFDVFLVSVFAFDDDFIKFGKNLDDLAGLVLVFAGSDFDGVVGFEFEHSL